MSGLRGETAKLVATRDQALKRLADDTALGYGRVAKRGREIRRKHTRAIAAADKRVLEMETERDAAVKGEGAMLALAREWEEFGRAQQERADAGDTRIEELASELQVAQIFRDVMDEGDGVSEVERARRRREAARAAAAPGKVPAVQPSQQVPERPGPGIGG